MPMMVAMAMMPRTDADTQPEEWHANTAVQERPAVIPTIPMAVAMMTPVAVVSMRIPTMISVAAVGVAAMIPSMFHHLGSVLDFLWN